MPDVSRFVGLPFAVREGLSTGSQFAVGMIRELSGKESGLRRAKPGAEQTQQMLIDTPRRLWIYFIEHQDVLVSDGEIRSPGKMDLLVLKTLS
jgi:hypothetical protein